jgi:hypothetical protein
MIFSHTDIVARLNPGAALPNQYGTGMNNLSTMALDSKPFRLAIPAASCAAATFLMCH